MRPAKIVAIVFGALAVLVGLVLIAPGAFLLWAYGTQRDPSGFFETSARAVSTSTYALTTPDVNVNLGSRLGNWVPTGSDAAVRIRATSSGTTALFIGVGPTARVSQYLANVAHDEMTNFSRWSGGIDYQRVEGGAPGSPPGQQNFWVVKQEGTGTQTLEWPVQSGNWTAVIMNADATAQVTASVSLGARFGILLPIGVGLTAAGVVLLAIGIVLIILGARPSRRVLMPQPPYPPYPPQGPSAPYPPSGPQAYYPPQGTSPPHSPDEPPVPSP